MTTDDPNDYDDLGDALREGRALRPSRRYRFLFALGDVNFRALDISDPVPLGRQILESANLDPRSGYSLFGILPSGDFDDVSLNEPFDLRARGAERFVAFLTDRTYKFTLNDDQLAWGKPLLSGAVLYKLAKPAEDEAVFLEVAGGEDRLIEPAELVDLNEPGIERFVTAPKPPSEIEIIVNARPRIVHGRLVTFEQIVQLAFPGTPEANAVFSMTYRKAASKPHAGELGAGGIVDVKKGTIFNVTKTVQS
ncbi:hypothetical protein ELG97_32135 (plasmid) [Rhizobium leguminosarum]|jgi:hypothetical protein|uniref:Multi-ubiquitin domain-containing protein n=1 Tax=Rhizobium leguminosarum TaxID=384 RepID=A0A7M3DIY3_RHILE|nr:MULTISPECIES: multiubiquitin domain-containing protein [Rhizobium]TAU37397.1 hypothetical protein ELI42_34945 [Rhizobium ruizarguesonis]TAU46510.1 hypothetical protein ELI44_34600 [Rhizobium ruizarguesonis]TAY41479.1 hypothetical protein ELH90_38155 [Rhizobium leguminosarum]TBC60657.1 hypothetical protein ELH27_34155 [Rhizobium leguminosarum]TBC86861.1 hypothetical protein ELH21_36530 [Rhizobium leguminosarum]